MMVSSATESVDSPAVRPFQCAECGSRYTRQEHLDRHISAKHRVTKEHVCATCGKGFARRDILRRHELGHAMKQEKELSGNESPRPSSSKKAGLVGSVAGSSSAAKKRTLVSQSEDDSRLSQTSSKAARTSRACNRCSRAKLRCDGKEPCGRCAKGSNTCTYDRAQVHKNTSPVSPPGEEPEGGVHHREGSRDGSEESYATGSSIDLDDDTFFNQPAGASFAGAYAGRLTPHDVIWNGYNNGALSPRAMSPYGAAFAIGGARPSPLGPGSLHAAGYHHLPQLGHQSPYYSHPSSGVRGNFSDSPEFPQTAGFAAPAQTGAYPALANQSSHAPFASQLALSSFGNISGSSPTAWASMAEQTAAPAGGAVVQQLGNGDFLDLISSVTQDIEIDWSLLNSYSAANLQQTQQYDNKASAELQNALLQHSQSQSPALPLHSQLVFNVDPPSLESSKPSSNQDTPGRDRSLSIQGHAAESLLQLASHTPRESPEPEGARSRGANTPSRTAIKREDEEEARSSHTSHLPSDPWPLSYRPTVANEDPLPAAARGTGYASRAMSPAPSGLRRELTASSGRVSSIAAITEVTRSRIVDSVRKCTTGLSGPEEALRFVPRVSLLNLFVQLYFEAGFHALLPLLHVPTFDPNAVPAYLVLAVASVGARYAHDKVLGAQMHAQALSETSRRMVQNAGDMDNTLLRTVPWQQAMQLVLYAGLVSGNKRDLERSEAFKSMAATFCKRQGWLHELPVDEAEEAGRELEERWTRWRDREEIKRLGFGAVGLDTTATLCWDMPSSSLFAEASHTTLPCHDQLWEAPTADAWAAQFRGLALPAKGLTTMAALHAMADRAQHSSPALLAIQRDGFAMQTVLGIIHALGWLKSHEEEVTGVFLPSARAWDGERASMAREGLAAAWEFYQDRVVLPPEIQRDMLGQVGPTTGLSFMLHLTALVSNLPLRLLQPLVRPKGSPPEVALNSLEEALKSWAAAQGGELARRTAHHAGQLLGLSNHHLVPPPTTGQPLEPFALFYGALALVVFCRYAAPLSKDGEDGAHSADQHGALLRGIALDRLVNPDDSKLEEWIKSGEGDVELEGVGLLTRAPQGRGQDEARGVVGRLLKNVGERLVKGEVWKIGEGLGRSLLEMVGRE